MAKCVECGWRVAEFGSTLCWHCLSIHHEEEEVKKRKEAIAKEKSSRNKPKETLDDIARKAHKHNLSYGKYLAARARGEYLSEVDE